MGFSRQGHWSGCHFLPQGIFPTPGLNPRLLHWQVGSLPLSRQGSMKIGAIWEQSEGDANPNRTKEPEHKRPFCPECFYQFCQFWERPSWAQGLPELRVHPPAEGPKRPPSPFVELAPRGQYSLVMMNRMQIQPHNHCPSLLHSFFFSSGIVKCSSTCDLIEI